MKKGFLKFFAVFMAVIMTAVYLPLSEIDTVFDVDASAIVNNGKVKLGDNIKWTYDNKSRTITVSGSGAMYNYNNGDDGQRWDELVLGLTHYPNKDAENLVIESGITSIGNNVFNGLKAVKKVTIPASVTSIGASAFEGCSALSSATLPSNLKTIGANAFKNTKAANISIPASVTSIGAGAFSGISGLKITCSYATEAYKYCLQNSISCALPENVLVSDVSMDTVNKQIKVVLKIAYNKAQLNAGNFTFTYSNAVAPVSTETVYNSADGIATAVVYNSEGKISVAMMAENYVPYSSNAGVCEFTFAEIRFNVVGQDATADFGFAADTLMMNNAKTSIKQASGSAVLHIYEEKVEKEATCISDGLKTVECSLCGLVKESIVIPKDSSKHGNTEVKNKKDATCLEAGYTGDTVCNDCGAVVTAGSDVPATGSHNYESVVTPATCTASGFTTYTCKVCANSYKGDFTAELGHDFDENGECTRCDEITVISVTFKDSTGITVNDESKVIIINKTLNAGELGANIASGNWVVSDAQGTALAEGSAVVTGSLIKAANAEITYTVIILGDVSRDGKVTDSDARSVLRVASRLDPSDDMFILAADCDGKANVSAADARLILRVASRLQTF